MEKTIWFDMDGTLADLYGIENWRDKLNNADEKPYLEAKPLLNMSYLARLLNKLQKEGYYLGIITWTAKDSDVHYHKAIERAKRRWLKKHLKSVNFNAIYILPYGEEKSNYGRGILFDDNIEIRKSWKDLAYDEKEILQILRVL